MMGPVVVIADDLSGAAELAGLARNYGLSAEVQRGYQGPGEAEVVAVDTDSRGLAPEAATQRVFSITQRIVADQPAWIFKKVDSVLRGNVRAEIAAILAATGFCRALLIPCNPSRGRCIEAGQYLIDGVPLDQTAFACDPEHPRTTAQVDALLADGGRTPVVCVRREAPLLPRGIVVPDVASPDDLLRRAQEAGHDTLLAGAADFFHAILRVRHGAARVPCQGDALSFAGRVLLVCGSRAAWAKRAGECRQAGIPVATIQQARMEGAVPPALLLGIGDEHIADRAAATSRLADLAAELIRRWQPSAVLVEGGATAAAIAHREGWSRFDMAAPAEGGVGVLRPRACGAPLFLIKPGSYAWPASIWKVLF